MAGVQLTLVLIISEQNNNHGKWVVVPQVEQPPQYLLPHPRHHPEQGEAEDEGLRLLH